MVYRNKIIKQCFKRKISRSKILCQYNKTKFKNYNVYKFIIKLKDDLKNQEIIENQEVSENEYINFKLFEIEDTQNELLNNFYEANPEFLNYVIIDDNNNNNNDKNNKNQQIRDMYILYKLVMGNCYIRRIIFNYIFENKIKYIIDNNKIIEISIIKNNLKYDDIKFEWMVNNNQYQLLFDKIVKSNNPSFNFKFDLNYNYNPKNNLNNSNNNNNNILNYFIKFLQIIQPINENNKKMLLLFYNNNNKNINIIYNNLKFINNSLISQLLINDLINDEQLTIGNKISFQSLIDLIL
ncbi:hypothetical protein ACTFIY_010441 [Dictyostelium cf. discoideum]